MSFKYLNALAIKALEGVLVSDFKKSADCQGMFYMRSVEVAAGFEYEVRFCPSDAVNDYSECLFKFNDELVAIKLTKLLIALQETSLDKSPKPKAAKKSHNATRDVTATFHTLDLLVPGSVKGSLPWVEKRLEEEMREREEHSQRIAKEVQEAIYRAVMAQETEKKKGSQSDD